MLTCAFSNVALFACTKLQVEEEEKEGVGDFVDCAFAIVTMHSTVPFFSSSSAAKSSLQSKKATFIDSFFLASFTPRAVLLNAAKAPGAPSVTVQRPPSKLAIAAPINPHPLPNSKHVFPFSIKYSLAKSTTRKATLAVPQILKANPASDQLDSCTQTSTSLFFRIRNVCTSGFLCVASAPI